jgi:hypothetical protein
MRKIILCFLLTLTIFASAQRVQNFSLFLVNTQVAIRFTVTKGSQCFGYTIWHSLDSINFNQLYNYPGTCGDVSNDQDYSYTHANPALNQVNFYKIELIPVETTPAKSIFVSDQPRARLFLFPNPLTFNDDLLHLKIFNAVNLRTEGFIFNQAGNPVKELDITTQADLASINISDLPNGLYVIWLTDGISAFTSKFIIYR